MTTEEIDKAAKEHAQKAWRAYDSPPTHAIFETSNDFKAGANFVNEYWQEKTRWKSLEAEPPKEPKPFEEVYLLLKHSDGGYAIKLSVSQNAVNYWLTQGFVEWKEIE